MAGGEERSNTRVGVCVYEAILGINPCKWFQEALKATLKCLGFAESPPSPPADDDNDDDLQLPLIMDDEPNDHKDIKFEEPPTTVLSRGSSSSSSSSSNSSCRGDGDYQEQGDVQPSTTDPSSTDPPSSSDPSSLLVLGRSRMPPRPPVSTGRGGQTN